MFLAWLVIGIVLLVIELMTTYFLVIFFSIGAFSAAIIALLTDSIAIQMISFCIVSCIGTIVGRDILLKYFNVNKVIKPSNVDAMIGKHGTVIKIVTTDEYGLVRVDGEVWSAKSYDGVILYEGKNIIVKGVDGVKLLVSLVE